MTVFLMNCPTVIWLTASCFVLWQCHHVSILKIQAPVLSWWICSEETVSESCQAAKQVLGTTLSPHRLPRCCVFIYSWLENHVRPPSPCLSLRSKILSAAWNWSVRLLPAQTLSPDKRCRHFRLVLTEFNKNQVLLPNRTLGQVCGDVFLTNKQLVIWGKTGYRPFQLKFPKHLFCHFADLNYVADEKHYIRN